MRRIHSFLPPQWIWAILLTIINLTALCLADPLQENISHIANVNAHPWFVYLWASSFAFYLLYYTSQLIQHLRYQTWLGIVLFRISCICMIISVLLPYQPDDYPLLADVHITLSTFATLLFAMVFLHILYCGYFIEPIYTQKILPFYIMIVGTCGMLYLLMGCVSTLLEVFFVIAMSWYMCYINKNK